uniref:Uncharacterized protein n=1 Tax=Arundo donax TaxID=35708 RepID=A0A0A9FQ81_ARUDO
MLNRVNCFQMPICLVTEFFSCIYLICFGCNVQHYIFFIC